MRARLAAAPRQEMVKAVILMLLVAAALVGLNLYLPQIVIFLQESYTTENAAFWSVFEPLLDCCGPATQCQGTQQQCDTAVLALIYAGQTYFNVVGGILLGFEVRAPFNVRRVRETPCSNCTIGCARLRVCSADRSCL